MFCQNGKRWKEIAISKPSLNDVVGIYTIHHQFGAIRSFPLYFPFKQFPYWFLCAWKLWILPCGFVFLAFFNYFEVILILKIALFFGYFIWKFMLEKNSASFLDTNTNLTSLLFKNDSMDILKTILFFFFFILIRYY